MGTVTSNKTNRMYWLGRYLERVYTTLKATRPLFDAYTDDKEADFAAYCTALGIPATTATRRILSAATISIGKIRPLWRHP